jgi:hypothetical protein
VRAPLEGARANQRPSREDHQSINQWTRKENPYTMGFF